MLPIIKALSGSLWWLQRCNGNTAAACETVKGISISIGWPSRISRSVEERAELPRRRRIQAEIVKDWTPTGGQYLRSWPDAVIDARNFSRCDSAPIQLQRIF